jgi:hypothetical protein
MDDALLELGPATSLVTDVSVTKWGSEVLVLCLYDPLGSRQPYQLVFKDCREVRWEIFDLNDVQESEADLIGFSGGADCHRDHAVITTDIFEVFITYGRFIVQRDW